MAKTKRKWTEARVERLLNNVFERLEEKGIGVDGVRTFSEGGILSSNKGVVVTMRDGSTFQITVVDSTRSY